MQYLISILRLTLVLATCGSLVSCSLFRPKDDDDDTWGDPHWNMDASDRAEAETPAGQNGDPQVVDTQKRRLIGSSRNSDYWPTTEELESRGGQLTMEDYERAEEMALESFGRNGPPTRQTLQAESGRSFSLNEPELPMPADNVDPLAGFWDDGGEDHSDDSIQRAGEPQDDPIIASTEDDRSQENPDPDLSPTPEVHEEQSTPPVLMPIPPSPQPPRNGGGSIVGSSDAPASVAQQQLIQESPNLPLEVVLLDAETAVTKSAFDDVSLLSDDQSPPVEPVRQDSFLDRRKRLSLTDIDPASEGPLAAPSIIAPIEGVAGNP